MKHPERVEDYLGHIVAAIERATSYLEPLRDFDPFQTNHQVQDAAVRNIEIIGEAVNKINNVAPEFIDQHPQLPWAQMRAMRNVVIHEYFFVDLKVVWTVSRAVAGSMRGIVGNLGPHLLRGVDIFAEAAKRGHGDNTRPSITVVVALVIRFGFGIGSRWGSEARGKAGGVLLLG